MFGFGFGGGTVGGGVIAPIFATALVSQKRAYLPLDFKKWIRAPIIVLENLPLEVWLS